MPDAGKLKNCSPKLSFIVLDGKRLAIGGQDCGIYIYRLDENENGSVRFSKVGKCIVSLLVVI